MAKQRFFRCPWSLDIFRVEHFENCLPKQAVVAMENCPWGQPETGYKGKLTLTSGPTSASIGRAFKIVN
jgi:hypothetical protein